MRAWREEVAKVDSKALTANFGIRIAATKCLQSFLCYSRALKIDVLQFREIRKCDDSAVRNLPAIPKIENLQIREEYEMLRQFFEIFISNRMRKIVTRAIRPERNAGWVVKCLFADAGSSQ